MKFEHQWQLAAWRVTQYWPPGHKHPVLSCHHCCALCTPTAQVENVEIIRAYGSLLQLVLARGKLLQRLHSALAALRKAAQDRPLVPAAMEGACERAAAEVDRVDRKIRVRGTFCSTAALSHACR